MMKRTLLVFLILTSVIFTFLYFQKREIVTSNINPDSKINNKSLIQKKESYIFVPYWTFNDVISVEDYDNVIYFGVSVDGNGINTNEDGYKKIGLFSDFIPKDKKTYLALRLLDKNIHEKVLNDLSFQNSISKETILIAEKYGFDGIVVDFETSAFGFQSTEKLITSFYKNIKEKVASADLEFITTLFGDTYYRARPYDVKEIALISDKVIIMAYDFHKARLNPGPNFPFSEKSKYGYDFKTMTDDFMKDVPIDKIIVAFGFFGYDWTLNENGVNLGEAEAMSFNQIKSRFLENCAFDNCREGNNSDGEPFVKYKDKEGYRHEVWFENEESVTEKIEFLKSKGIRKTTIWAYSFY